MDVNDPPYSDAVVIFGHSDLYSFESLGFTDILVALLHPKPLVFLGCCGGNHRYGPLKQLSLLPEWQNTIFSYFQRQVYKDELCNTIPVLALQYYLHLDLKLLQWHNKLSHTRIYRAPYAYRMPIRLQDRKIAHTHMVCSIRVRVVQYMYGTKYMHGTEHMVKLTYDVPRPPSFAHYLNYLFSRSEKKTYNHLLLKSHAYCETSAILNIMVSQSPPLGMDQCLGLHEWKLNRLVENWFVYPLPLHPNLKTYTWFDSLFI